MSEMSFGTRTTATFGGGASASADGHPKYKPGGVTIDWDTVPANAAQATLADGDVIAAGVKFLPFGCLLARIDASGKYGPYEPDAAADGRQDAIRGRLYVLNYTARATDLHADNPPGVFDGGRVFIARLKAVTAGVFAATDAWTADVQTALPGLFPADTDL
jgi:hypothetical protein